MKSISIGQRTKVLSDNSYTPCDNHMYFAFFYLFTKVLSDSNLQTTATAIVNRECQLFAVYGYLFQQENKVFVVLTWHRAQNHQEI